MLFTGDARPRRPSITSAINSGAPSRHAGDVQLVAKDPEARDDSRLFTCWSWPAAGELMVVDHKAGKADPL